MSNLTREALELSLERSREMTAHLRCMLDEYAEHVVPLIKCARRVVKDPCVENLAELASYANRALL